MTSFQLFIFNALSSISNRLASTGFKFGAIGSVVGFSNRCPSVAEPQSRFQRRPIANKFGSSWEIHPFAFTWFKFGANGPVIGFSNRCTSVAEPQRRFQRRQMAHRFGSSWVQQPSNHRLPNPNRPNCQWIRFESNGTEILCRFRQLKFSQFQVDWIEIN